MGSPRPESTEEATANDRQPTSPRSGAACAGGGAGRIAGATACVFPAHKIGASAPCPRIIAKATPYGEACGQPLAHGHACNRQRRGGEDDARGRFRARI